MKINELSSLYLSDINGVNKGMSIFFIEGVFTHIHKGEKGIKKLKQNTQHLRNNTKNIKRFKLHF